MKKLSYSKIGLNTGGKWYWNVKNDEFGLNLNIGLTDAFSLNFTSEYSGLSSDFLNLKSDAMGVYFLTNFKLNFIKPKNKDMPKKAPAKAKDTKPDLKKTSSTISKQSKDKKPAAAKTSSSKK